ncbi:hypothetical protein EZS27_027543 [termite gut metagenome]|uniref:Uncharacterized protein n=1 Tax=termite gut metagenome TaxID=433724 RepID=A0A5J4QQP4_9ZZZZ
MGHKYLINRKTTDSEIAITLLIAARYFGGNIEKAISFVRGLDFYCMRLKSRKLHVILCDINTDPQIKITAHNE